MTPTLYRGAAAEASEQLGRAHEFAFVLAVVLCRLLAIHSFHVYDDAFITYRYAQNLAAGHGLVFNPGAAWEPVLGTTTPGYALLIAAACVVGLQPVPAALALNTLCDAVSALLLLRLLRARPIAAVVAALAFAVIPEIGRISVGGMEPPLFVMLALGAALAAERKRLDVAGWLAALDCTVRPEAVMLVGLLALLYVRSWRDARRYFGPVLVVGVLASATLWIAYGHPIPQSVRAKAGAHGLGPHLDRMSAILAQGLGPSPAMRVVFPLAALGFVLAIVCHAPVRPFVLFGLSIVAAYCAVGVKTWGWYFYVPLTAWCAALGIGTDGVFEFVGRAKPAWKLDHMSSGASLTIAAIVVGSFAGFTRLYPDRVSLAVYAPMQAWIREEGLDRSDATVIASDIGALGYFSGARILDSEGLVWPEARRYARQVEVIKSYRPDYVMLVVNRSRIPPFRSDPIYEEYEPLRRFTLTYDSNLEPQDAALPTWWEQDYIVYRRRDFRRKTE